MEKKVTDKRKELLLKNVQNCINKLIRLGYDDEMVNTIMPLLYVLVAHRHGVRFETKSPEFNKDHFLQMPIEYELDRAAYRIINGIARHFPNLIKRELSYCIIDFYEENQHLFKDYYTDIIEYLITKTIERGGRGSSEYTTPSYMVDLLQRIILLEKPHGIYDPCAGLCSIAISPKMEDIEYEGLEINESMHLLASIRLDAHNRPLTVKCGDVMTNWNNNPNGDCLCSDLPMGVKVSINSRKQSYLDDEIISKFIETVGLNRAVLVLAINACSRQSNYKLRKLLCENNYIDMVIELPNSVLSHTGVKPVILVLNKTRKDKDVRFISASDCLINGAHHEKSIDIDTILKRIKGADKTQFAASSLDEIIDNDYNISPSLYIKEDISILPGQKLVPLNAIASFYRGETDYSDKTGRILERDMFSESLSEFKLKEVVLSSQELDTNNKYLKLTKPCVIFSHSLGRFFIKYDDAPLFIRRNYFFPFEVDTTKCSLEYFVLVMQNPQVLQMLSGTTILPHISESEVRRILVPYFEDLGSQKNLVERAYREVEKELRSKVEKLQELSGRSSDLLHNLGVTFTRMGAAVAFIQEHMKDDDMDLANNQRMNYFSDAERRLFLNDKKDDDEVVLSSLASLDDNIQYALRQINSTGTDFATVTPNMDIVDIEAVIEGYCMSWDNVGYGTFKLLPLSSSLNSWGDTKVKVDVSLLYTMLDCILTNAHQHGFNRKADDRNQVSIELKPVTINEQYMPDDCNGEEKYVLLSVSNNGKPLPEGFTLKDFFTRGVVGINSTQDGIGGDHICKIAHHFGGRVSIESSEQWLSINILIPMYIYPKETNFTEYEYESI